MEDNLFEIVVFSHNPYFNRWFSAIINRDYTNDWDTVSQSLF